MIDLLGEQHHQTDEAPRLQYAERMAVIDREEREMSQMAVVVLQVGVNGAFIQSGGSGKRELVDLRGIQDVEQIDRRD